MVKRITVTAMIMIAMVGCIFMMSSHEAYAIMDLELRETYIDLDQPENMSGGCGYIVRAIGQCSETIAKAEPVGTGVVCCEVDTMGDSVSLFVIGKGHENVKITGSDGSEKEVTIDVGDEALQKAVNSWCDSDDLAYGEPRLLVDAIPGTKVSLKVGSDSYKSFTAPMKQDAFVRKFVKMKRMYKVGTKITVKFKKGNATLTKKYKVIKATYPEIAKGKKKIFRLYCWNIHKGDVVKLTVGGKTYKRKIKKNYTDKLHRVSFRTKRKIKKNARFKVVIWNKYKQRLNATSQRLSGYRWEIDDSGDE